MKVYHPASISQLQSVALWNPMNCRNWVKVLARETSPSFGYHQRFLGKFQLLRGGGGGDHLTSLIAKGWVSLEYLLFCQEDYTIVQKTSQELEETAFWQHCCRRDNARGSLKGPLRWVIPGQPGKELDRGLMAGWGGGAQRVKITGIPWTLRQPFPPHCLISSLIPTQ